MKRFLLLVLALALLVTPLSALAEEGDPVPQLLVDMYMAAETPSAQTVGRLEQDMAAVDEPRLYAAAVRAGRPEDHPRPRPARLRGAGL